MVPRKGLDKDKVQEACDHGIEGAEPPDRLPSPPHCHKRRAQQGYGGGEREPDIQYAEGYRAFLEAEPVGNDHGRNHCHNGQADSFHETADQHQPDMRAERPQSGAECDKRDSDGTRRPAAEPIEYEAGGDGKGDSGHGKDGHEKARSAAVHLEGADEERHEWGDLVKV